MKKPLILILALALASCHCRENDIPDQCFGRNVSVADPALEQCLTTVVWGEARSENKLSKIAVAWSVINRSRISGRNTCDEIARPHQYSVFGWHPDLLAHAMSANPEAPIDNVIEKKAWDESREVARMVLNEQSQDPTDGATHYVAKAVMKEKKWKMPTWTKKFKPTVLVGSHQYYVAKKG